MKLRKIRIASLTLVLLTMILIAVIGLGGYSQKASAAEDITVTIDNGTSFTLQDSDGDGYYEINTADGLYAFVAAVNSGKTAINVKLNGSFAVNTSEQMSQSSGQREWALTTKNYTGIFDGNGNTISGLYLANT